jgi:hypothetical protein
MSEGIYNMNMSVNFLLQATRVLSFNNYDEDELKMVYDFMISIDNEILNDYNMSCSIMIYNNDLELYVEVLDALINIFEDREEYEKCQLLIDKKEESLIILEKNTI